MKNAVKAIPDGYHAITPYLVVDNASKAIDFYTTIFGAQEVMRMPGPGGKVMHAELKIGDSMIMLADENPDMDSRAPQAYGGSPVSLMLYIEDVDGVFNRAISAGAKELRPLKNQFYGDRSGALTDPFGHKWTVSTHVEDVSPEEMQKRMAAQAGGNP